MKGSKKTDKTRSVRLGVTLLISLIIVLALSLRLMYLQIVQGPELRKSALQQWMKSIDIQSNRGVIYDRTGKKLAVNMNGFSVWAYPKEIEDAHQTALTISDVLDMDEEEVYEILTKKKNNEKITQWIERNKAEELRDKNLKGIKIEEETKRFYPNGNFASHILGFTNIDNFGLDGVELTYNEYLMGRPGKWFKMTDANNRQLPYGGEKIYEPDDGNSVVLTIDETIQGFVEKAAQDALIENEAKSVSVIVMEPDSGDIIAMANKPDFDPNNPRAARDENQEAEWAELSEEELQNKWYEQWRNFAVTDIYEPGSTFKLVTAAAALEEGTTTPETPYNCTGFIRDIPGEELKCARWYNPHGYINFKEGMDQSCNVVFVNAGRQLGKEKLYKYTKAFGFGEKTYIDLLGEQYGLLPATPDQMREVNLATLSYGQGIAVTPIQLIRATAAITNGGNLMKPRIVKEIKNDDGEIIEKIETERIRQVISKETSTTMLQLMETVVSEGSGGRAQVPGYRVGGKTGTAQKVIDGVYAKNKYIASFIAVAPIENPELVVLVIIDEPVGGKHYGGTSAAPVAKSILEDSFKYLEIGPTELGELDGEGQYIEVPDVNGLTIKEAGKRLADAGLRYVVDDVSMTGQVTVVAQSPEPWSPVPINTVVDLKLNIEAVESDKIPYLVGKTREEAEEILKNINITYIFEGEGERVKEQLPLPGEELETGMTINIKLE